MTQEQLTALGITAEEYAVFGVYEKMFLDISERLSELLDLRWIDIEAGQLEVPMESYPVQFPCALIDFPQSEFQDETHGNQQGLMFVQIRLGIDLYEDLHMVDGNDAPEKGVAIKRLQIITKVHKLLQGFETEYSTPMSRTGIQSERRDDGIKVFVLMYGCAAKDDSAAEVYAMKTGVMVNIVKG
ncbi:MAG: hypothetical protein Q8K66_13210 [Sediminibacterium sp.]|nr:hypothetical protein [Sediminibacterium sp.]MDP3128806.1 hypothetical protein [Sediminibacterium sp.]